MGKLFVDVGTVTMEIPAGLPANATSFETYYVPDNGYGWFQLLFLGACYAYILFMASNMISDGTNAFWGTLVISFRSLARSSSRENAPLGSASSSHDFESRQQHHRFDMTLTLRPLMTGSELLMLIPSLKGIVGPVVLPILGAVPDGAIVIFSGLGPIAAAQEQVL